MGCNDRFGKILLMFSMTLLLLSAPALAADDQSPLRVIQSGTEKALEIIQNRKPDGKLHLRERRNEILQIVDHYFDFEEMAKRSLGAGWKSQPPQKQETFVKLFKDLLFNTYVDRVENYTAANEKVVFDGQKLDGDYAVVNTRVTGFKGGDVDVIYSLRLRNGQWKVYDVVIAGVSLVNNYRSQFNSILAKQSFDDLLKTMNEKVSALNKPV